MRLMMLAVAFAIQSAPAPPAVVFVCEHGAAKSVIATAYFNKLAAERGLPFRATFRGTSPQNDLSVRTVAGLNADGVPVPSGKPAPIGDADVAAATHIFAIGCTLPDRAQQSGKASDWVGCTRRPGIWSHARRDRAPRHRASGSIAAKIALAKSVRIPGQRAMRGTPVSTVLVTGGSGFIGSHCILQLLAAGHQVRTTVRSAKREADVRALLTHGGADDRLASALRFFVADLEQDAGWREAAGGSDFVLHVASPFPSNVPKNEDELIVPAREGALRVLRASRDAGVKRVVLTSSFAAIGYGHKQQDTPFDETTWTNINGDDVRPYVKSKAIAERAAWDFIAREGGSLELAVVNPVGVFGPVLGPDYSTSILIVQRMMDGAMPGCPQMYFGAVDVRDVADLHLRAMTHPAAKGERFLAVSGDFMSFVEIARLLKARMGAAAKRVPTRELPNWLVRVASLWDPAVGQIVPELGKFRNATSAKAQRVLGWKPRSREDAIVATAESLVSLGLLKAA